MQVVTVKMSSDMLTKIDALMIKLGLPRSVIIRNAVEYVLDNKILPPPVETEKCNIVIPVRMPNKMLSRLDMFAYKHKLGRSDVIRRAIEAYYKVQTENEEPIRARVEVVKF
jgi:metal-responsive CopG/Arc/MetJ family transcriptional regulator